MIYLDNAATTALDPEVIEEMTLVMNRYYGNPSSIHQFGRESRVIIEESRRKIANYMNVSPAEILFTAGGTEALNIALSTCVNYLGVKEIITSTIEHPAVLNTIKFLEDNKLVNVKHVRFTERGIIDLDNLEVHLNASSNSDLLHPTSDFRTLVCLMHANNEIGNLLPMKETSMLCKKHNAFFLSDMVQTMSKYINNLKDVSPDFTVCSAHKFHGPKGIGFLFADKNLELKPVIHGGGQERNVRSGTENIYGIAGLAKAFEVAHRDMDKNIKHISELKSYAINKLKENFTDIEFNGDCENNGLYTILNVSFPESDKTKMLVQKLDMSGIAVSGGSACHSAEETVSYVLRAIGTDITRTSLRISFSKFNNIEEIDIFVKTLLKLLS